MFVDKCRFADMLRTSTCLSDQEITNFKERSLELLRSKRSTRGVFDAPPSINCLLSRSKHYRPFTASRILTPYATIIPVQ